MSRIQVLVVMLLATFAVFTSGGSCFAGQNAPVQSTVLQSVGTSQESDDSRWLTPSERSLLVANPDMNLVGGQTPAGADEAGNLLLIGLAMAATVGVIALIAVAASH